MPMRMGGGGHHQVEDIEAMSRANGGSLLNGGPDTEVGLYHRVVALAIAQGLRAARHRALQGDPRKLDNEARSVALPDGAEILSPLERWERILRLRPAPTDTVTARRAAVAMRRSLTGESTMGTLVAILLSIFGDWPVTLYTKRAVDLNVGDAYWPLGANTPAYPGQPPSGSVTWTSEVAALYFGVEAHPPASVAEKARRIRLAVLTIDDVAPAHAYTFGTYL